MKKHNSKVNLLDFARELAFLRKKITEEIKSAISNNGCSAVHLKENGVNLADETGEIYVLSITKHGRTITDHLDTASEKVGTLNDFTTEMLMLILKTLHKNPKVFKNN